MDYPHINSQLQKKFEISEIFIYKSLTRGKFPHSILYLVKEAFLVKMTRPSPTVFWVLQEEQCGINIFFFNKNIKNSEYWINWSSLKKKKTNKNAGFTWFKREKTPCKL